GVAADPFFQVLNSLRFWFFRSEQRPMNIIGTVAAGATNNDPVTFFFPFQNGSRPDAESFSHVRWNGNLSLSGNSRMPDGHAS
ncbi:MAG: hypothetical protein ACRD7E_00250, partial [Bryobacteraceae bacterium]